MVGRIEILRQLAKYPVFTVKTVKDIFNKEKNYGKLIIYRLKKAGLIFALEKNKYTLQEDPLIAASHIVWPSYITSWAALSYHHLTEQLPRTIDVVTSRSRKKKEISFGNGKINFIKTKPEKLFGFKKTYYQGFKIFVADAEKAIADAFIFNKVSVPELLEIISKNREELDLKLIKNYVKKMARKNFRKKVELFLKEIS